MYFPKAVILAVCCVCLGAWIAITGRPIDPSTGKPTMRWQIGALGVTVLGLVIGIWLSEAIRQKPDVHAPGNAATHAT
jgi:hypothetical protein